jgi:hypothetical protein
VKGAKTGSRGDLGVLVNDAPEAIATFDAEVNLLKPISAASPTTWFH